MVQWPGFKGGQEHRFYQHARKYTGIFWELTEQQVQEQVESLSLISLEGFCAEARRVGNYVPLALEQSDPNQGRPPPQ
jgi:hypothetical protein